MFDEIKLCSNFCSFHSKDTLKMTFIGKRFNFEGAIEGTKIDEFASKY
jgi:hypothetical protein